MNWPQIVSSAANAVTAGAVTFGAYVANKGINAWRREALGRRKIELAERGISLFSRAKAIIREARNPFIHAGELVEVYRAVSSTEDTPDWKALSATKHQYYAAIHRLQKYRDVFIDLDGLRPLFTSYFGDSADHWFEAILKAHREIGVASEMLVRMAERGDLGHDVRLTGSLEAKIWYRNEDDEISLPVNGAVSAAIECCREVLKHDE